MIDKEKVWETLSGLGPTVEHVVAALERESITGGSEGFTCPIAQFLNKKFPEGEWRVTKTHAYFREALITDIPRAVMSFIQEFDAGRHTQLQWNK
jgi:hypothetical protein